MMERKTERDLRAFKLRDPTDTVEHVTPFESLS